MCPAISLLNLSGKKGLACQLSFATTFIPPGPVPTAMMFAHGFGCDQNMWRHVSPAFEDRFQTILFDHVGAGGSDLKAYDSQKYSTLAGYADDVVEIGTNSA